MKKVSQRGGKKITEKDITIFTRQLAVMMKAGVPLLQAFDIVGKGHANPSVGKLLLDIKTEVETGSSLGAGVPQVPAATSTRSSATWSPRAKQAGILDTLLDRLATYKEKILAIKGKIKGALFYPIAVIVVALRDRRGDHDFRDPGVQGPVQELRRGPAGTHADRAERSRTSSSPTGGGSCSAIAVRHLVLLRTRTSARPRCSASSTG